MDFRSLQLFKHLATSLHFGDTAEAMYVSPSTLSRVIQRLEDELGCTLFKRDNRKVALTHSGHKLLSFSTQALKDWQQLKADLAYDYDIYCENAIKSVNDGIAAVQVLIENDKLLVDVNKCGHTYSSLSSYKWNPKTENPKPVHDWASHASDAVRYAIYTHQKRSVGIFAV